MAIDLNELQERVERVRNKGVLPGTLLEVDWAEAPTESGPTSPLERLQQGLRGTLDLHQTIDAIDRAAADRKITGLVARAQFHGAPVGVCQELRAAIERFRAAGKSTVAFAETFTGNAAYYVAAAFERVVVLGAGELGLHGLATATPFLGEALPNAGIQPQFLQRHEYKSVANLFTETDYTPPHREATEALLHSTLDRMVADLAADRGLDEDAIRDAIAAGPHSAAEAMALGLIDAIGFQDEVWEQAMGDGHLQYLSRYHHHSNPKKLHRRTYGKRKAIALVPIRGVIAEGKSGFKPGLPPGPGTGSDTLVAGIRTAAADDDVVAIVLRVDSPGGSAVASEVMARAIEVARAEGTPVVASMGSIAASGGYYVSAPCDRIVANPSTITGSIGVASGKLVVAGLLERAKVAARTIESSPNALLHSSLRLFTDEDRASIDAGLDRTYELFLERVAAGRGLSRDEVHEVARGRVWTGADAAARGLVDVLGGLHLALAEARELAGLARDEPVRVQTYPKSSPLDVLQKKENSLPAAGMGAGAKTLGAHVVGSLGDTLVRAARGWERQLEPTGAQLRLHGDWRIR